MGSMPRGSYKDQFHQRLYVQLNQGAGQNQLDNRRINQIRERMQDGVDNYAHMLHDEAEALGMSKH